MLVTTVSQWKRHHQSSNYKQLKTTHKYWNQYPIAQLQQLIAIADALIEANGAFVAQRTLLWVARSLDATTTPVLALNNDGGAPRFAKWVTHCLGPAAVQFLFERGTDGHASSRGYFYAAPVNATMIQAMQASFRGLQNVLNGDSAAAKLRKTDMNAFLSLLPDRKYQRVLRAFVGDVMGSKTFVSDAYGWSAAGIDCASDRVSAAIAASAAFAERDALTVPTGVTTEGAAKQQRDAIQAIVDDALNDKHAGGRDSLEQVCDQLGLDLKQLMEDACAKLSSFSYENDEGTAGSVSARRDSIQQERRGKCTWPNLAREVQAKINECERTNLLPLQKLTTVLESTMRRFTAARSARSLVAQRHKALADISASKLTSKAEAFNIDAQASNAFVRVMEQQWAENQNESVYRLSDDHAKWEADKKRGYVSRRTVMLKRSVKNAPSSDMGVALGGIKAVTNTMLVLLPLNSDTGEPLLLL